MKNLFGAYTASFRHGMRVCLSEKAELFSMVLVYATLLAIFFAIFKIMPVQELGARHVPWQGLFWYLVVTEIVLIAVQGNEREFGKLIAEGQLTVAMQRPGHMLGLWISRISGTVIVNAVVISAFAVIVVPVVSETTMPLAAVHIPFLIVSLIMSMTIFLLIGYCVSMLEIFGPYSRSCNWIVNKLIFTFGGLFFPVIFFPKALQDFVHFTPCPAILFVPGSFMLHPTWPEIIRGMTEQAVWLLICLMVAISLEKRMTAYVSTYGD